MDLYLVTLRLLHVGLGVFWAGAIFFAVLFLEPSVRAAGPSGAPVMQALVRRHYLNVLPIVALLTILSGLALYWRVSGGFAADFARSPFGMSLGIGTVASIVAFVIGVSVMRPAVLRVGRIAATVPQLAEGPQRDATLAEVERLRGRARTSGRWVAALLGVTVVTMAVARYV